MNDHEVHMFSAVAKATPASGWPEGELHPLLVLVRQSRHEEHDFGRAESLVAGLGWVDIDITRAGTLPDDARQTMDARMRTCYDTALSDGGAVLVYANVVRPAHGG
jgi:hypothetical protein